MGNFWGAPRGTEEAARTVGSRDGIRHLRADDGIRTRDPHLGKVMLYQLSHVRMHPLTRGACAPNCPACVTEL